MNEQEKERAYNEKTLQIDHGSFTCLVLLINGSMGKECQKFYSPLSITFILLLLLTAI